MPATVPVIPETITVHLGTPDSDATNVTVPFIEYIKNVASSEIYPTWPLSAIRANIFAQITFALNRIYTEYYRSRGYNFDITNTTQNDQAFVYGRDIYFNISQIVDDIFNNYIRRMGSVEPIYAQYCNGTTSTCDGLSQWGTVDLANQGLDSIEILKFYYGEDIEIVTNTRVEGVTESVPPVALEYGSTGNEVKTVQVRLNRISQNYPAIPKIANADAIFGDDTVDAVRAFQQIFGLSEDGIVGKATWYQIELIYNSVKRISELNSEGLSLEEVTKQYPDVLKEGDEGDYIRVIQYYLEYISTFIPSVQGVAISGYFGEETKNSVISFQNTYELVPDGIVGIQTYDKLIDVYTGIIDTIPESEFENLARPFPGIIYKLGMESENIRYLQEYLNYISDTYTTIPKVEVNGFYGVPTENAVLEFERLFNLNPNGIVAAVTWNAIGRVYNDLRAGNTVAEGQFPGYQIS